MSGLLLDDRLARAVELRESGRTREALDLLLGLCDERSDGPGVNLQCAWAHDKLGLEGEAVPYYERALELGLDGDDLEHALRGLGSTYRALGEYDKALTTLTRAVEVCPDARSLQVFLAIALYNSGRGKEACEMLLRIISATSADQDVLACRAAIDTYAEDLDRTWP